MTTVEQRNPATGETIGAVQSVSGSVVAEVVAKARAAQHVWAALSFKQRAKYLQRIKAYLVSHLDEACDVISRSTGKLRQDALATEVMPCVMACDWYANNTAQVLKPQRLPSGSILFANKTNELQYVPVGVVGIISPWNYPFSIPFGEVLMALMAGNAVLLKVAANTALVGSFIESCIAAAELPPHLFTHLIVSGAEVGPAFLNAGINKLFFTGSVRVGKQLMAEAAKTLTPLSLELGGNDPMIVLDDASIERAVNCACWAGFQNAGQSCGGVERIYVQRGIYDAFLAQLIRKTKALRHGPECGLFNVDVGSMTTKGQYDTVQTQLNEALAGGAQIVAQSQAVGDCTRGMFIPATVLVGCTAEMSVLRDETFGPLLPVMVFDTEDEVVGLANACTLALTSSVFSGNAKRAKKLAARLESGVVSINDHLYTHGMSEAPWGGWKESGLGRTHGYLGLKEMSNVKCINTDCASGILPRNLWWYPFDADSFRLLTAAVHFVAPQGVCDWFSSVAYIVGHCGRMFTSWKVE